MLDRVVSTNNNSQQVGNAISSNIGIEVKGDNNKVNSEVNEVKPLNSNEKEKVSKVVDGLNEILTPLHLSLKFEFHEELNEYYVTLIDDQTKEVVKEIPSKKMLDFYAAMTEAIGLMIDKKI
ncbi:flagellar protein FlaG [Mycobacteroides abscessus subsp. abscessus]|nr:flagellar protein FlaG [Mycobacteroides abscessus subsp. abscessus]